MQRRENIIFVKMMYALAKIKSMSLGSQLINPVPLSFTYDLNIFYLLNDHDVLYGMFREVFS